MGGVVALPSVEVGGADGRALSFMRAAASARVTGGGAVGGVAAGGAEGPACAGGGAEGPALSRKKYGETPVLAALLKMSPMPRPVTTSSSSSTFMVSSAGATRMFRNHGSSEGRHCLSPLESGRLVWVSTASMSTRACVGSR